MSLQALNVKRLATVAIILVQLWVLSPVCCCWFKAQANGTSGSCCCSQGDDESKTPASSGKDRNCRCSENKVEILSQSAALPNLASQSWQPIDDVLAAVPVTSLASIGISQPWYIPDLPPPLSGADRLYEQQRLNL